MNFTFLQKYWPYYLIGAKNTILLSLLAVVIGTLIGMLLAVCRVGKNRPLKFVATAYVEFIRGTPLLVQLFIIYYGAGQWGWLKESWAWNWFQEAWFCALLSFMLNTSAYTAEIIRGAIRTIPRGEIEAAQAFGMTPWQTMKGIVLPSALRRALPAYSNEVIFMLHGSAVAGIITVVDLTGAARIINARYYSPFEAFLTAGLLYMMLSLCLVWLFRRLELRWHVHLRPRTV